VTRIWWHACSAFAIPYFKYAKIQSPPTFLVLHVSGNNIGITRIWFLCNQLKNIIFWLKTILPDTILVWSQILPRCSWRFSNDLRAMEKCRYRLNNSISSFVLGLGGRYIHYPEIRKKTIGNFLVQMVFI